MEQGRVPLEVAVTMASATPAAFLGLGDRIGTIAAGMRADLVLLDDDFTGIHRDRQHALLGQLDLIRP